jgi:hypothetical protein
MKLAPKLTAVVAEAVVAVVVVAAVVVAAVVVAAVVTAVVVTAVAVAAVAVAVVGTNNPVLSKKLDARYWLFNNSGLKESWHRITPPFCLAKKAKKRSYRYTFK